MATSTKETASELQKFAGNEGAKLLHDWMEAMRLDVLALATAVDDNTAETVLAVAALTNVEE